MCDFPCMGLRWSASSLWRCSFAGLRPVSGRNLPAWHQLPRRYRRWRQLWRQRNWNERIFVERRVFRLVFSVCDTLTSWSFSGFVWPVPRHVYPYGMVTANSFATIWSCLEKKKINFFSQKTSATKTSYISTQTCGSLFRWCCCSLSFAAHTSVFVCRWFGVVSCRRWLIPGKRKRGRMSTTKRFEFVFFMLLSRWWNAELFYYGNCKGDKSEERSPTILTIFTCNRFLIFFDSRDVWCFK